MPGCNTGTNTIVFICKNQVPKEQAKRGDRVHYPGDAGTPTADLLTVKLLINGIISTEDFYLNNQMARYKYMCLCIADMPEEIIEHYNLHDKATPNGYVF